MITVEMMEKAALMKYQVRIVDTDGKSYNGRACGFTKPDDEESGFASIWIQSGDSNWCLDMNEIEDMEIV